MKNSALIAALNNIEERLDNLENEDLHSAQEIKDDLFILINMLGEFNEYLEPINDVEFTHKNMIFSSGNIHKVQKFIDGKNSLTRIIVLIKKEISLGKLKPKMLPKPEKISLHWIFINSDLRTWFSIFAILAFTFAFGLALEARYNVGKKIVPWILSPSSQLQLSLQAKKQPPQKEHRNQN